MRRPYSVRLFDYSHTSGGIRVMYGLYAALLLKGEEVYANAVFQDASNIIGIYPEISTGNELNAGRVVRYLLNKPGVMALNGVSGPVEYAPTDIQFSFSKLFTPDFPDDRIMFLPIINTEIFKDQKKNRTKKAVFVGKGFPNQPHTDCVPIDRQLAQDQQGLADLLNECQMLYTYDPVSAMTEVARLCGCPVVYLSKEYTKEDYLRYEPGINGMSFDDSTPELDCEAFTRHYKDMQDQFYDVSLPNFIKVTQE